MNWCLQNSLRRNRKSFVKLPMKLTLGRKLVGLSLSNSGAQPIQKRSQKRSRGLRPRQKAKPRQRANQILLGLQGREGVYVSHCQIQMSLQQLLVIRAMQRLLWMFRLLAKTKICPPDHNNKMHKLLWTLATHLPTDPSDNKMKSSTSSCANGS